ncbi:MAG: family N-acetyltransferase [Cyanobacteria bacterium RYN_339]|nr:family N-acetyltransferase [Cyanobacteria bacterium RYN_339]
MSKFSNEAGKGWYTGRESEGHLTQQGAQVGMDQAGRAALLDDAFAYPEFSSFFSPARMRARLDGLLETGSPYLFRRDGLLAWLGQGAHAVFINYLAASGDHLTRYVGEMMAAFEPLIAQDRVTLVQIYAVSPAACAAFEGTGFQAMSEFLRMRFEPAGPVTPDPRVRPAREEDITPIARVAMRAFPNEPWPLESWEETMRLTPLKLVAMQGEQAVGVIMGSVNDETMMISGLAIDPDAHGGGLGTVLVQQMLAVAHAEGRSRVEVLADGKSRVVQFYERAGFNSLYPGFYLAKEWRS